MEMHLQPLAITCFVSGEPFVDGARVASYLVRSGAAMEIVRYDLLETKVGTFAPEGFVACKWVQAYKARRAGENPDRALKLTAENLFVALADPTTEPTPENTRLVQFLALMLERKKILRPKGQTADGARNRYEHAKSKAMFEIPAGELTPEFFVAVQEQLSVLVGSPKVKSAASDGAAAPAPTTAEPSATPAEPPSATANPPPTNDSVTPEPETVNPDAEPVAPKPDAMTPLSAEATSNSAG